jgi:hypothetical protein
MPGALWALIKNIVTLVSGGFPIGEVTKFLHVVDDGCGTAVWELSTDHSPAPVAKMSQSDWDNIQGGTCDGCTIVVDETGFRIHLQQGSDGYNTAKVIEQPT